MRQLRRGELCALQHRSQPPASAEEHGYPRRVAVGVQKTEAPQERSLVRVTQRHTEDVRQGEPPLVGLLNRLAHRLNGLPDERLGALGGRALCPHPQQHDAPRPHQIRDDPLPRRRGRDPTQRLAEASFVRPSGPEAGEKQHVVPSGHQHRRGELRRSSPLVVRDCIRGFVGFDRDQLQLDIGVGELRRRSFVDPLRQLCASGGGVVHKHIQVERPRLVDDVAGVADDIRTGARIGQADCEGSQHAGYREGLSREGSGSHSSEGGAEPLWLGL